MNMKNRKNVNEKIEKKKNERMKDERKKKNERKKDEMKKKNERRKDERSEERRVGKECSS